MKNASVSDPSVVRQVGGNGAAGSSATHARVDGSHPSASVSSLARSTFESLVDLLSAQIRLARTELALDARKALTKTAAIAAFIPMIFVGYIVLCFALAAWLDQVMPAAAAYAIAGFSQILLGAIGTLLMVQRLRRIEALDRTKEQVDTSISAVGAALSSDSPEARH